MLLVAALCAVFAGVQLAGVLPPAYRMHLPWGLLGVFALTTLATHYYLGGGSDGAKKFVNKFMLATTLRFMLYLLVLMGYFIVSTENKQAVAIHFLLYYVAFTVAEVGVLYAQLQKPSPPNPSA